MYETKKACTGKEFLAGKLQDVSNNMCMTFSVIDTLHCIQKISAVCVA